MSNQPAPVPMRPPNLTPAAASPAKSLVAKLAEVMAAIDRIPKNGRNEFHKYDYATEADIVSAIRGELAQRCILLIPAITGRTREPVGEKGSVLTHLDMEFTFMDGETNETITRPWLGAGSDKEDKGAYKAMTGGEKYFLLKTFLIPTGDDPEVDDVTHPQAQENRRSFEQRKVATATPATAARPDEPDDPLPGREELPEGAVYIVKVDEKSGTSKSSGKAYLKFTITDSAKQEYSTFSASLAKLARECKEKRTAVVLNYESNKFGNDLIEINFPMGKPSREPGQEG